MMNRDSNASKYKFFAVAALVLFLISSSAHAAETQCKLQFTMKSWSFFYKSGKGSGTITCDNGQSANVRIRAHGGGLTFGKDKTLDGHGTFSRSADIKDLFGSYAVAEAKTPAAHLSKSRAEQNQT